MPSYRIPLRLLLLSLFIALVFPVSIFFLLAPEMDRIMVAEGTNKAFDLARHIEHILGITGSTFTADSATAAFREKANDIRTQFRLYKLSLFTRDGKLVFSTDVRDPLDTVIDRTVLDAALHGREFAVYGKRGALSLEQVPLSAHVIEAYIPIQTDGGLSGILEIYYDITETNDSLNRLKVRFAVTLFVLALGMFGLLLLYQMRDAERRSRQRKTEEDLTQEQIKSETIFSSMADHIIIQDRDYRIIYQNQLSREAFGDHKGEYCYRVFEGLEKICEGCPIELGYQDGKIHRDMRNIDTDHGQVTFEITAAPLRDTGGAIIAGIKVVRDITDRRRSEEMVKQYQEHLEELVEERTRELKAVSGQLHQSQKMEAIGMLAGGVAHDFNNILSAIIGFGNLLQMKMPAHDPLRPYVQNILTASERAANLTQSLLAFSRKQIIHPQPLTLNEVVRNVEGLLRRVIGEDINLSTTIPDGPVRVMADRGQIEQILMNLATNARDAMPHGGRLAISLGTVAIDEQFISSQGFGEPGSYALLTVADDGSGMDEATRERIFEPFFTTKALGRGTGLGLAIVYGAVKQNNGYIAISSTMGEGSMFSIYLPLLRSEAAAAVAAEVRQAPRGGSETILVAEDDDQLVGLVGTVLTEYGYTMVTARDGVEAVELFRQGHENIDLVILDVIMPRMNGRAAYNEIRQLRPEVPVLFMSGYTADILGREGIAEDTFSLLSKPITPDLLLMRVREMLDGIGHQGGPPQGL